MEPGEFLESAKALKETNSEGNWRTSISRAYYCAYHSTLWLDTALSNHAGVSESTGSHARFSSKLKNYPTASALDGIPRELTMKIKSLGYFLGNLHSQRTRADYDLDDTIFIQDVVQAIKQCEKILELAEEIKRTLASDHPDILARKA